jgi:hypothetical protein
MGGGATTATDDDQLLASQHRYSPMGSGWGYVMSNGEFFDSRQCVSVPQGTTENC